MARTKQAAGPFKQPEGNENRKEGDWVHVLYRRRTSGTARKGSTRNAAGNACSPSPRWTR
jgi:hypothetical protein